MNNLTTLDPRELYHQPHLMGETVIRIEKVIETAAALERWEELRIAIDFLIDCQATILNFWKDHVQQQGGDRRSKSYERKILKAGRLTVKVLEQQTNLDDSRVARWRAAHEEDLDAYRERIEVAARRKAELEVGEIRRVNTGEYEWYTPQQYLEAAREVMGGIDLDPASHPIAQTFIQAREFFTAADDGLSKTWHGRIWLNPPYAQPLMANFVRKLVREVTAGNVSQAIMLTHNYTDTAWFHEAQAVAALLCFTRGRISFVGAKGPPTQGQAFFYFGNAVDQFRSVFSAFGFIR